MAVDNLTLALNGDVSLANFAKAMRSFSNLVEALTHHEGGAPVRWRIEDLKPGSATTTAWGQSLDTDIVPRIVRAYIRVGFALAEESATFPYPSEIERPARDITGLLNGEIVSVRFESPETEVTVAKGRAHLPKSRSAYGAVSGTIETLQRRRGLKFTLYDDFFDRAVSCYLREDQEEQMRDWWGRRAIVEGWVSRDPITGAPTSVRNIEIHPVAAAGDYRLARGAVRISPGMPSAEEAIRKLRDA